MTSFFQQITNYAVQMSSEEPTILAKLRRRTHLQVLYPRMISGPLQGRILSMFAQILSPQRILEIGTFTGYSCICLAEGLTEGGKITTIEINPELAYIIEPHLEEAGIREKVDLKFGNALRIIPGLTHTYDLVFIDADKRRNREYYELILPKIKKGGIILVDNVLWSGKVLNPIHQDKETIWFREFNEYIKNDSRVTNVLLPIRDGMMMIRKN